MEKVIVFNKETSWEKVYKEFGYLQLDFDFLHPSFEEIILKIPHSLAKNIPLTSLIPYYAWFYKEDFKGIKNNLVGCNDNFLESALPSGQNQDSLQKEEFSCGIFNSLELLQKRTPPYISSLRELSRINYGDSSRLLWDARANPEHMALVWTAMFLKDKIKRKKIKLTDEIFPILLYDVIFPQMELCHLPTNTWDPNKRYFYPYRTTELSDVFHKLSLERLTDLIKFIALESLLIYNDTVLVRISFEIGD